MILPCSCFHLQQDKLNGIGMRVFNPLRRTPGSSILNHRCTVCGAIKGVAQVEVKAAEEEKKVESASKVTETKKKFSSNKKDRQSKPR